jgi:hypothetical protein
MKAYWSVCHRGRVNVFVYIWQKVIARCGSTWTFVDSGSQYLVELVREGKYRLRR